MTAARRGYDRFEDLPPEGQDACAPWILPGHTMRRQKRGWVPPRRVLDVWLDLSPEYATKHQALLAVARTVRLHPRTVEKILRRVGWGVRHP